MLLGTTTFLVNDDQVMESIASGRYTGRPVHNLVFIGFLPGALLQRLYLITDRVPWYALLLLSLNAIALGLLTAIVLRRRRALGFSLTALAIMSLAAFGVFFLFRPTFTVTAMLLTTAAIALASTVASTHGVAQRTRLVIVCVLLATASTIRFEGVLGIGLAVAPAVVVVLATLPRRTSVALAGCASISILSVRLIDVATRNLGGWRAFNEFNSLRSQLHGTVGFSSFVAAKDTPPYRELLLANRWTPADLRLFRYWLYDDPVVYSVEKIRRLVDAVNQVPDHLDAHAVWNAVLASRSTALLAGAAMVVALFLRGWRAGLLGAATIAASIGVGAWLAATARFPIRVSLPIMLAALLVPLCIAPLLHTRPTRPWRRHTATAVAGAAIVLIGTWWHAYADVVNLANENRMAIAATHLEQRALTHLDPAGLFVRVGPFATETTDTAASLEPNMLPAGWMIFSPVQDQRVSFLGVDQRLLPSLIDQPHRYLLTTPRMLIDLESVYRLRLHIKVRFEKTIVLPDLLTVYRVVRVP